MKQHRMKKYRILNGYEGEPPNNFKPRLPREFLNPPLPDPDPLAIYNLFKKNPPIPPGPVPKPDLKPPAFEKLSEG